MNDRFKPISWNYKPLIDGRYESIKIDLCLYDGTIKYAIRNSSSCLNKNGNWEHEPLPSNRDDEFFIRCRFDSLDEVEEIIEKLLLNG
jgi:hypothetical protein